MSIKVASKLASNLTRNGGFRPKLIPRKKALALAYKDGYDDCRSIASVLSGVFTLSGFSIGCLLYSKAYNSI